MAKREKRVAVYLPRSTVKVEAVIAVEMMADRMGVSFGKALERLLEDSERYRRAVMAVEGKLSEVDISA